MKDRHIGASSSAGRVLEILRAVMVAAASILLLVESWYGLRQALGWGVPRPGEFLLGGHFRNPGPLGGYLAVLLAITSSWFLLRLVPLILGRRERKGAPSKIDAAPNAGASSKTRTPFDAISPVNAGAPSDIEAPPSAAVPPSVTALPNTAAPSSTAVPAQSGAPVFERVLWLALLVLTGVASLLGIVVVGITLSRTAWAGLALAVAVFVYRERMVLGIRLPEGRKLVLYCCLAAVLLGVPLFLLKKESAIGRLLIWNIDTRVILHHPLKGVGKGRALGAYALEQGAFFREKERSEALKQAAGCPPYAFNEYLRVGMEHGIPAMLACIMLALGVVLILLVNRSPFGYGALVYAIFAFGSYPLHYWQFRLLALALVLAAAVSLTARHRWPLILAACAAVLVFGGVTCLELREEARREALESEWSFLHVERPKKALQGYERLYPDLRDNYRFLYEYGRALFRDGQYEKAVDVLREGSALSAAPMFHYTIGRSLEKLQRDDEAEKEYILVHEMIPGRLYGLVLLMELYHRQGRTREMRDVLEKIRQIPVNPDNKEMVNLRKRAERRG